MRNYFVILFFAIICFYSMDGHCCDIVQKKDTTNYNMVYGLVSVPDVHVRGKRPKGIYRNPSRLERIVYKVYPIAKEANATLREMEKTMMTYTRERDRVAYVKDVEKQIKKKYTPILMRMTTTEGIVLLKLIDRETGDTSYKLVQELRGKFTAFFWQGIARLFSVNLKSEYDAAGKDQMIEYYIQKYEREHRI